MPLTLADYWPSLLAFATGVAAGFHGIHQRYPTDSGRLVLTGYGMAYLVSRGILPAALFCILQKQQLLGVQGVALALLVGTSAEALLRTQTYVGQYKDSGGIERELYVGPFRLLRSYQDYFLKLMSVIVARRKVEAANELVLAMIGGHELPFGSLVDEVGDRLETIEDEITRTELTHSLTRLRELYDIEKAKSATEQSENNLERRFRLQIVYKLRKVVGDSLCRTLLGFPPKTK